MQIFENKFVYAYQYGQAIAYTGSVADYAAAKAAIAAKEDFEVTLDGTGLHGFLRLRQLGLDIYHQKLKTVFSHVYPPNNSVRGICLT